MIRLYNGDVRKEKKDRGMKKIIFLILVMILLTGGLGLGVMEKFLVELDFREIFRIKENWKIKKGEFL